MISIADKLYYCFITVTKRDTGSLCVQANKNVG